MRFLLTLAFAAVSNPATAHAPVPGIEGVYVGLVHPLSTPPQLLLVLATGILLGQFAPARIKFAFPAIGVAALAGLILGQAGTDYDLILLTLAFSGAVCAALLPGRLPALVIAMAAGAALVLGMVGVPDPGPQRDRLFTMTGTFIGINILILYAAGLLWFLTERFPQDWRAVGFRVVAAWIAALSALLLALSQAPAA